MAYTETQLNFLLSNSLLYDEKLVIADAKLFESINNFYLIDNVKTLLNCTLDMYFEYLEHVNSFSNTQQMTILKALKQTEIIDNHCVERENVYLLREYMETRHGYAVDYLSNNLIKLNKDLNNNLLLKSHEILMRGTNNSCSLEGFRKDNKTCVRFIKNNINIIRFLPISYDEIVNILPLFYDFFNNKGSKPEDIFIIPFLSQLLLATFQLFYDGNTRLSRTLSHVKILDITNHFSDFDFSTPALYYSKQILPYIDKYRDLIYKFVSNPINNNLNEWIKFNLYRVMDQIYYNENNLDLIRKR